MILQRNGKNLAFKVISMNKTVFKIRFNNNTSEMSGEYKVNNYDEALAIVAGFVTFITEGKALYTSFFDEIEKGASTYDFDDDEKLEILRFVKVLRSFFKKEELIYLNHFPSKE